jgi:threonine dehydratase
VASLQRGEIIDRFTPDTIADGLRAIVGVRNFRVIRDEVSRVLTVSDDDIRSAMILFWQTLKILIEPSSATVIAAVRNHPEIFADKKVGAIISGGNIHPADWLELTGSIQP